MGGEGGEQLRASPTSTYHPTALLHLHSHCTPSPHHNHLLRLFPVIANVLSTSRSLMTLSLEGDSAGRRPLRVGSGHMVGGGRRYYTTQQSYQYCGIMCQIQGKGGIPCKILFSLFTT